MTDKQKDILLVLEVPPSVNDSKAVVNGHLVKTAKHRAYVNYVHGVCLVERIKPLLGELSMKIRWYREAKRGDIDGRLKTLLDSLTGCAYADDSQIADLRITRLDTEPKNPRIIVTLEPLN